MPGGAPVLGAPEGAVVRADPQHVRVEARLRQGRGRAALGGREDARDGARGLAPLDRAEGAVAGRVVDAGVVAAQQERRVPVEAHARTAPGARAQPAAGAGRQVPAAHAAVLTLVVDEVGVLGIDADDEAVAATHAEPVAVDGARVVADHRRATPAAVVLQAAVDEVRVPGSDLDVVELTDGDVAVVVPGLHPVPGHVDPAVVAEDHVLPVRRVDPQGVVVHVDLAAVAVVREGLAAVGRAPQPRAQHVDALGVTGVDADLRVVHRARVQGVDPRPGEAAVLRAEDAAVLVAVGALVVLGVGVLAAEADREGARVGVAELVGAVLVLLGPPLEGDVHGHGLAVPHDLDAQGLPGEVLAEELGGRVPADERGVAEAEEDVALLEAGLGRRAVLGDLGQARPDVRVLGTDAQPGRVLGLLGDALGLDHREGDIGLRAAEVDADAAQHHRREAVAALVVREAGPGGPAVGRAPQGAARSPLLGGVVRVVEVALALVARDQQDLGIGRVHRDLDDAGHGIDLEHPRPALAAVGGLVEAALVVRAPQASEGRHVDRVRIVGVDGDLGDLERLLEARVVPGQAAVRGAVDPVAEGDGVPRIGLARAHPHLGRVGRADRHGADGADALGGEAVLVGDPAVGRVQQAAGRVGDPGLARALRVHRDVGDAPAHVGRSDAPPVEGVRPLQREGPLDLLG